MWQTLVYVVLPLWVIAGLVDYLCHRASHIEQASGARESFIHWLMLGEVAAPLAAAEFLKVNALVIALMLVFLVAHEITGYFDLKLAMPTRRVTVFEHQVHSVLEMMPLTAVLLVMILHWPQALALFGAGPERADFSLALKPLPSWGEAGPPFCAFFLLAIVPYLEELVRGMRGRRLLLSNFS